MSNEIEYLSEEKIVLYCPRDGKTIKKLYKEIEEDPTFKPCSNDDILWAWMIGIPNSPVSENISDSQRWRIASVKVFGEKDQGKLERYSDYDVPDYVKEAVEKFKRFSPEARLIAQNTTQKMIFALQKLAHAEEKDFFYEQIVKDADGNVIGVERKIDFQARKQYVETCKVINQTLPELLKKIEEGGYGVTETRKAEDRKSGNKAIDIYHNNKKE